MLVQVADALSPARINSRENSIIDLLDKLRCHAGKAFDKEASRVVAINNNLLPTCALTELLQYVTLEQVRVLDTLNRPIVNTCRHDVPSFLVSEET